MPIKLSGIFSSAEERIKRTEAYAEKVRMMFAATVNDILALNKTLPKLDEGTMYSFDGEDMKTQKEVERLLRRLHSAVVMAIKQGITLEWEQANRECDNLVSSAFGKEVLNSTKFKAWTQRNTDAMQAFINRSDNGLNLSDRVWKPVQQLRDEMEVAITIGIVEGESAASMSRRVRQYLNDPDLMFRRFRYKNDKGEWKLKWKKRIKDEDTGKYKWIDYDKDSYRDDWTGKGYYKSSAQNAMRVTRTETNIAYRRADHERWMQMDFVLGQRVKLSHSHPVEDICDKLQGDYPKDFVFEGWHPQCFCYVTPILVDESEMGKVNEAFSNGKVYTPQGKQVTEYPEDFKSWVKDHKDNIANARKRGTEPYFIKHNASVIDNILNPKKQLTAVEKAKIRHDARTAEQIKAIKEQWAARQKKHALIKKIANNVLKVAEDYSEVDYSKLQQYISDGNLTAMQAEAKAVAKAVSAMKKQEAALSALIPDVHEWHKQFTLSELQAAYDSVEDKLKQWASLSLEQQATNLHFEAIDYLGGNMKNVQSKYKTWEVSQSAYMKKLSFVNEKIAIQNIKNELSEVAAWSKKHTKSKKVASLLHDAESAIANGEDITSIKKKYGLAIAEYQKRIAEQARRDAKKTSAVTFTEEDYSQDRKNAALWSKEKDKNGLYDRKKGDDYFRKFAEKDWDRWTEDEKDVAYLYTSGSAYINEPLYTVYYAVKKGLKGEIRDSWKDINTLTNMIDKSKPFTKDVWLNRGASKGEFTGQFGLNLDDFISNPNGLIGSVGEQKPFMSTAHSKSWGFVDDGADATCNVVYNIYCPKGTKGIYTEPYSAFGNGGRYWDGKTKYPVKNEVEVILQRGTRLRVIKAEYKNGQWFIDMEVVGQPIKLPNQP